MSHQVTFFSILGNIKKMTSLAFTLSLSTISSNLKRQNSIQQVLNKTPKRHTRVNLPYSNIIIRATSISTLTSPKSSKNHVNTKIIPLSIQQQQQSTSFSTKSVNSYKRSKSTSSNCNKHHQIYHSTSIQQDVSFNTFNNTSLKTYDFNIRLKALARKKNSINQCLQIYKQMQQHNVKPDKYTYSTLLTSCLKSKAISTAFDLYTQLQNDAIHIDNHLRANLLSIAAVAKPSRIDFCLKLFQSTHKPSRIMCNVMIDAFARVGRLNDAVNTFRHMTGQGISPDAYTVSALTKAYVKSAHYDQAFSKLKEMHSAGLQIPSAAFGQVMDAYGKLGQLDDAMKVFDTMILFGVPPTQITFNILIGACAHEQMKDRAFEIFEEMKHISSFHGDRYTYHSLMKCCLADSDCEKVLNLYRTIRKGPFQCNQVSYRYALQAAAFLLDLDSVLEIADDMKTGGCKPREDTAAMLVAATIRCSDLKNTSRFAVNYIRSQKSSAKIQKFFTAIREALCQIEQGLDYSEDYLHTAIVVDEVERNWQRSLNAPHPQAFIS